MSARIIPASAADDCMEAAAEVLRSGEVLALPTDTVYGLGVDAADADAVQKLFAMKGRPADRQIAVLVADMDAVERIAELTDEARRLAREFWPGPLTLVARRRHDEPGKGCSGLGGSPTVGVRLPDCDLVRGLAAQGPLAVTSANLHGEPTPATARELARLFPGLRLVIDGGALPGAASTVVDVTGSAPVVLREGPVTAARIAATAG